MEIVCLMVSVETHPGEGISSIRGTAVLATNQETLPSPLPCAARARCWRQHFHPKRLFLVPRLVPLHPLGYPVEWPA